MQEDNTEEIIIKRGEEEIVLQEGRIRELTSKFIELCGHDASLHNDFGMNAKVVGMLIDIKKAWWPATQKSITANVKDFDSQLEKWYNVQKGLLDEKKKQEEVYEVVGSVSK